MTSAEGITLADDPTQNPFLTAEDGIEPGGATRAGEPEGPQVTPRRQTGLPLAAWWREVTRSARVRPAAEVKPKPLRRESKQARLGRFLWRFVLGATVAVILLRGILSVFGAGTHTAPVSAPVEGFPKDAAQAAAVRYATTYYTGTPDERTAQLRAAALALDTAPGVAAQRVPGRQQVIAAVPAGVRVDADGKRAVAAVSLRFAGNTAVAPATWVTVGVPVAMGGERPVVTGDPALLPVPAPGEPERETAVTGDAAASAASREAVQATFSAMAAGDAVALSQVSAPGSTLTPLPKGVTFRALESWEVQAGGDETRQGRAVVTWTLGAGIELRQAYAVTLRSVTSGATSDWRVTSVTADH